MCYFRAVTFPASQGCLFSILLFYSATTHADQFVSWAGYEIHFATFSSLIIPVDVAQTHGIVRAKNRIVTNISIQQHEHSVKAMVVGTSTNLLGQVMTMDFAEVVEHSAVYYLANQVINERDTIRFHIQVQPEGADMAYNLKFTRQYY